MRRLTVQAITATLAIGLAAPTALGSDDALSQELRRMAELTARPLPSRGDVWVCTPRIGKVCAADGCDDAKPTVRVRLDFTRHTYSRCDEKGCDTYGSRVVSGGIFTTADLAGTGGTFVKVLNDGSEYVEVVTMFLAVQQNFGSCAIEQPSR